MRHYNDLHNIQFDFFEKKKKKNCPDYLSFDEFRSKNSDRASGANIHVAGWMDRETLALSPNRPLCFPTKKQNFLRLRRLEPNTKTGV